MRFQLLHLSGGQFDPSLVDFIDQLDEGMLAMPGHGLGKPQGGRDALQQDAVPAPFDGIILAVIRRIVGQADGQLLPLAERHDALEELGSPGCGSPVRCLG